MNTNALRNAFTKPIHYPIIILSDIHLGKKSCSAEMLYEFLEHHTCDTLVLNGDIVDGWVITAKRHRKFPEMQKRVMDLINERISKGLQVIYIPGNHDEALRKDTILGKSFFNIHFSDSLIYTDRQDRRFFILHGDQFDPQFLKDKGSIAYRVGDALYDGLIELNAYTSRAASKLLSKRFSIAAYAKHKTKNLMGLIGKFEEVVANSAADNNADGVICGHIHHAEFSNKGGVLYGNSGDWVESCTALVSDYDGNWSVRHWLDERDSFGCTTAPSPEDRNPYLFYRPMTEAQLLQIQEIWPARDLPKLMKKIHGKMLEAQKEGKCVAKLEDALRL